MQIQKLFLIRMLTCQREEKVKYLGMKLTGQKKVNYQRKMSREGLWWGGGGDGD
jgi:hypothetical protein